MRFTNINKLGTDHWSHMENSCLGCWHESLAFPELTFAKWAAGTSTASGRSERHIVKKRLRANPLRRGMLPKSRCGSTKWTGFAINESFSIYNIKAFRRAKKMGMERAGKKTNLVLMSNQFNKKSEEVLVVRTRAARQLVCTTWIGTSLHESAMMHHLRKDQPRAQFDATAAAEIKARTFTDGRLRSSFMNEEDLDRHIAELRKMMATMPKTHRR